MNTAYFIAKRINSEKRKGKRLTRLIRIIAITSIALGLAVMILAVAVVTGFQTEVREKVIGFGAHIQITNFDYNLTAESTPINKEQAFLNELHGMAGIRHIQQFATKAGILKTDEDIHGVVFKGVGDDFDRSFFLKHLKQGGFPDLGLEERSDEVFISASMASRLRLATGDDVFLYFIQDPPRIRRFLVAGVYETGLEELDRLFVLGDIRHVQRLNDWEEYQVGGFEVLVDNFQDIAALTNKLMELLPYDLDARSIRQVYPQIFDWLALLDMNVVVILVLMLLVASMNMITTLLISILEKTSMIGILKALGASIGLIRRVFLYHAGLIIIRGLLIGNMVGLGIAWMQQRFSIMKLSQESYYVSVVPINLDISHLLLINAGTFVVCMAMLVLPSVVATRISPVKAIAFK